MLTFEETVDSSNRICPYCKHSYQVEGEDYSDEEREEECYSCKKKYYAFEEFSVIHYSIPDCELNGEKHTWQVDEVQYELCLVCGAYKKGKK